MVSCHVLLRCVPGVPTSLSKGGSGFSEPPPPSKRPSEHRTVFTCLQLVVLTRLHLHATRKCAMASSDAPTWTFLDTIVRAKSKDPIEGVSSRCSEATRWRDGRRCRRKRKMRGTPSVAGMRGGKITSRAFRRRCARSVPTSRTSHVHDVHAQGNPHRLKGKSIDHSGSIGTTTLSTFLDRPVVLFRKRSPFNPSLQKRIEPGRSPFETKRKGTKHRYGAITYGYASGGRRTEETEGRCSSAHATWHPSHEDGDVARMVRRICAQKSVEEDPNGSWDPCEADEALQARCNQASARLCS